MSNELGLQLNISVPDIKEVQAQMVTAKNKAPLAVQRAINSTIKQVSRDVGREAKQKYIISQPEVRRTLHLKKATKKDLTGVVSSRDDKKPRLYGFKVTPKDVRTAPWPGNQPPSAEPQEDGEEQEANSGNAKPEFYAARIKKRVKEKNLTGNSGRSKAFVTKMKRGHIGVFERMKGTKTKGGKEKLAELYGMSIPSMIKSRDVAFEIQQKGQTFLEAQVQTEIRRVMGLK